MTIARTSSLLCLLFLLVACSTSSTLQDGMEPSAEKEPSANRPPSPERLLAEPPHGWKLIYQINNRTTRLSDFVPADESEADWSTNLSFESFQELIDADPIEILLSEVERDKQRCSFVQHFNLFSGLENGYPASVRLFLCGRDSISGNGEIKMVKAIQGEDYFYFVKMFKQIEPFIANEAEFQAEEIAIWSTYLRKISLCNSKNMAHSCPDP